MTKPLAALLVAFTLATSVATLRAEAFYWGYSPYSTASSLGYVARSVLYGSGLYRGFGGYGGYGAPGYLVNSLVWNGAYAAGQGVNSVMRRNAAASIYQGDPNPRGKLQPLNNGVVDQITLQTWRHPQLQPTYVPQTVGVAQPAGLVGNGVPPASDADVDPAFMPVPQATGDLPSNSNTGLQSSVPGFVDPSGATSPLTAPVAAPQQPAVAAAVANELPPLAPNMVPASAGAKGHKVKPAKVKKQRKNQIAQNDQAPPSSLLPSNQAGRSPFAGALVDHINTAFGGDITRALSDKQTCKFARAVGVIPEEGSLPAVSPDRVELVKKILSDPADDAETKLQTVRMLLKH